MTAMQEHQQAASHASSSFPTPRPQSSDLRGQRLPGIEEETSVPFVWYRYCMPALEQLARIEAREWASATERETTPPPRDQPTTPRARTPSSDDDAIVVSAPVLRRWLVAWVAPWLPAGPAVVHDADEVVGLLVAVRTRIQEIGAQEQQAVNDPVLRPVLPATGLRAGGDHAGADHVRQVASSAASVRRGSQVVPLLPPRRRSAIGLVQGTLLVQEVDHCKTKRAFAEVAPAWAPVFIQPHRIACVERYLVSRQLSSATIRMCEDVAVRMLHHAGVLLSRRGIHMFRLRLDADGATPVLEMLKILDTVAKDDHERCLGVVKSVMDELDANFRQSVELRQRQSTTGSVAGGSFSREFPTAAAGSSSKEEEEKGKATRLTVPLLIDRCGYRFRPEHVARAERSLVMLDAVRPDTVVAALEDAVRGGLVGTAAGAAKRRREVAKEAATRRWERVHAKVQGRPDLPQYYVRPDTAPQRRAAAGIRPPRFCVKANCGTTELTPRPPVSTRPQSARVERYAQAKQEEREAAKATQTVDFIVAQRLAARSLAVLEECEAVPEAFDDGSATRFRPSAPRSLASPRCPAPPPSSASLAGRRRPTPAKTGLSSTSSAAALSRHDELEVHRATLRHTRRILEAHARRPDATTMPDCVYDLRANTDPHRPTSVPRRSFRTGADIRRESDLLPAAAGSPVLALSDRRACDVHRIASQQRMVERLTAALEESGGGVASVTMAPSMDIRGMVSAACDRWLKETGQAMKVHAAKYAAVIPSKGTKVVGATTSTSTTVATSTATAQRRPNTSIEALESIGYVPFDPTAMMSQVDADHPTPSSSSAIAARQEDDGGTLAEIELLELAARTGPQVVYTSTSSPKRRTS